MLLWSCCLLVAIAGVGGAPGDGAAPVGGAPDDGAAPPVQEGSLPGPGPPQPLAANGLSEPAGGSDVNTSASCKEAFQSLCSSVLPGDGRVARCLRKANQDSRDAKKAFPTTKACRSDLYHFFKKVAALPIVPSSEKVIAVQPVAGFREACAQDLRLHCGKAPPFYVLSCLKGHKEKLTSACKEKVFEVQTHEAKDMALDAPLHRACDGDVQRFEACRGARGPGAKVACLRKNRKKLSVPCREQLFKTDQETAGDIRLNFDVLSSCKAEVSRSCKDVEAGEARILQCLWELSLRRSIDDFSTRCREKVHNLTALGGQDYRLNFRVRSRCQADMAALCATEKAVVDGMTIVELFGGSDADQVEMSPKSGSVLSCLKSHMSDIKNRECRQAMFSLVGLQSYSAKADPVHERNCAADIQAFCKGVPDTRVHNCLRKNMHKLSPACKQAEVLQGGLEAGSVGLKPHIAQACRWASRHFCADVPQGEARLLRCLQDHRNKSEFPGNCRSEVEDDMEASSHDWRLKFGISDQCQDDIHKLCAEHEPAAAGKVLECLKTKLNKVSSQGCKGEMRRHIKQGTSNIKFSPTLYSHCTEDVHSFCKDVSPGGGAVHECLLDHRREISLGCAQSEFQNQAMVSADMRLDEKAMKLCGPALKKLCPEVVASAKTQPSQGTMWDCLEDHLEEDHGSIGPPCRNLVRRQQTLKHSEFHLNLRLAKHCEHDAGTLCTTKLENAAFRDFSSEGEVITCLMEHSAQVNDTSCKSQLKRLVAQRAQRPKLDPNLKAGCQEDEAKFCSTVPKEKLQQCLDEHDKVLSAPCREKRKFYQVKQSEDIAANPQLRKACDGAIKLFCEKAPKEDGAVTGCLLSHLHNPKINENCRSHLVVEQKKRATDLDHNPRLKKHCGKALKEFVDSGKCQRGDASGWQITCLTDHVKEIKSMPCRTSIQNVLKRQSADLRATPGMEAACEEDGKKFCNDVQRGAGRWHECLRKHFKELSNVDCANLVNKTWARDLDHASMNFGLRKKCANEETGFCRDVTPGKSRKLACLYQHQNEPGFSQECRDALKKTNAKIHAEKKPGLRANMESQIIRLLKKNRGFLDRYGAYLMTGTVGFVILVAFAVSYCIIQKKVFNAYTVVVPKDLEG